MRGLADGRKTLRTFAGLRRMSMALALGASLPLGACGTDYTLSSPRGDSYEVALRQADTARGSGDYNSAIPLYGKALQIDPGGAEAKIGLGQSFLAIGANEEAAAQFRDVLEKRGGNNIARRGLASALLAMNQTALAMQQLEAAVRSDPRDYRALNAMGVALDMQGRHVEAQERYTQGLQIAPENLSLRSNLGLSLAICGEAGPALDLLIPAASSRSADVRVRQNLAFAYAMAGDFEKSLQLSRRDVGEQEAQRQLSYFMQLRSLPVEARSQELRRNPGFFPQ